MSLLIRVIIVERRSRDRQRDNIRVIRRHLRDTQNPFEILSDRQFSDLYRFPKPICRELINKLMPLFSENERIHAIPCYLKVLCALRFFATGSFQRAVGQDVMATMSQTSVSRTITEVAEALNSVAHEYVRFPTDQDMIQSKQQFFEIMNFPGVIGLVDGTHIRICAPNRNIEHVYYCRKGGHSKNVQIVCDANYMILNLNARFGGTAHDAYIWRRSNLKQILEGKYSNGQRNFWLLGDSGYPLQPWLMTPIQNGILDGEIQYNVAHKKTRSLVERCIGILKSRFRCLSKERVLYYTPEKSGKIINACAVLHNILTKARVPLPDEIEYDDDDDETVTTEINPQSILIEARRVQSNIVTEYFN